MGSLRVVAGDPRYWNLLARAASAPVASPAGDANFPVANAYDGRPSKPFRWGTLDPNFTFLTVDGNLIPNGNLDTWAAGAATGWSTFTSGGFGTITQTSVAGQVVTGSAAKLHVPALADTAAIYRDVICRAGEAATLSYSIRGDGSVSCQVQLQNLQTGKYLNSSLAWVAGGPVPAGPILDSETGAAHRTGTKTFTVEPLSICLTDTVTLRVSFTAGPAGGPGDAYVDNVALYPSVDVVAICGNRIDPAWALTVRSSTDNFAASNVLQATASLITPSFCCLLSSPLAIRYWRIALTRDDPVGTDPAIPEVGEVVFAQTTTLGRNPEFPIEWGELADDVAAETPTGEVDVAALTKFPRRTLGLHLSYNTHATMEEGRDVWRRTRGRAFPLLIIPDTDRPDVVLGRHDRSWKTARTFLTYYNETDLTVAELPFASSTL